MKTSRIVVAGLAATFLGGLALATPATATARHDVDASTLATNLTVKNDRVNGSILVDLCQGTTTTCFSQSLDPGQKYSVQYSGSPDITGTITVNGKRTSITANNPAVGAPYITIDGKNEAPAQLAAECRLFEGETMNRVSPGTGVTYLASRAKDNGYKVMTLSVGEQDRAIPAGGSCTWGKPPIPR